MNKSKILEIVKQEIEKKEMIFLKHEFSKELYIAYSFCEECGNKEFIVDGQTQFCNQCGGMLFRDEKRLYTLEKEENDIKKIQLYEKEKYLSHKK